jgi:hypothetical protein
MGGLSSNQGASDSVATVIVPPQQAQNFYQSALPKTQYFFVPALEQTVFKKNKWLARTALALSISSVVYFILVNTLVIGNFLSLVGLGMLFNLFLWGGILIWLGGIATGVSAAVLRFTSPESYGGRGKAVSSVILSAVGFLLIIYWFARNGFFN